MNIKNTNFRLKEQCKGQQVEAEQHLQLIENSNVFLLCHSIKAKVEEQCFSPESSPIFTIPPCTVSQLPCGGCKGVSGGAEAFIKTA